MSQIQDMADISLQLLPKDHQTAETPDDELFVVFKYPC
jgi:hypothetical protein